MTRESPRELASALDELSHDAGETAAQRYVTERLANGWDLVVAASPDDDDDELIRVLDCDGWAMLVERDDLPASIDIETLPVTSL